MKAKTKVSKVPVVRKRKLVNDETGWGWATEINLACDKFFRERGLPPEPVLLTHIDYGLEDR